MSPRRASPLTLEYVLLGLLQRQPAHGYSLNQALQDIHGIGLIWHVKQSQMYKLLDKLEGMDWLASTIKPGESFAQRKEYRITPQGEHALLTWLSTPATSGHRIRQEFLARLYFALQSGQGAARQLAQAQSEVCLGWLHSLQDSLHHLQPGQQFERLVLDFRIGQVRAIHAWLENKEIQQ